ncbi:MAG: TonB C-terminal domain-containing protein [Thermodesulfobacteriota bacterium]
MIRLSDIIAGLLPDGDQGEWKIPLSLSLVIHLAIFLLLIFSPFLQFSRTVEEIHTVNLFSADDLPGKPAAKATSPTPAKKAPAAKPAPAPPKAEPQVSIPEEKPEPAVAPPPKPEPVPEKAVSLEPLKTKKIIEKKVDVSKVRENLLQRSLQQVQDRLQREKAEKEAKLQHEKARKEAQKQIKSAVETIRQTLQTTPVGTSTTADTGEGEPDTAGETATEGQATGSAAGTGTGAGGGDRMVSEARRNYYAALLIHLSKFWKLPETVEWADDLEAVAVIWLRRDGSIIKSEIEKKSSNVYFNRFVEQTLEKAAPLPPIPPELPEEILDLGIRFRPQELL